MTRIERIFGKKVDKRFLESGTKESSMRYVMIETLSLARRVLYFSFIVVGYQAYTGTMDWFGYAAFIASVTAMITTVVIGKQQQYKQETIKYLKYGQGEQIHNAGRSDQEPNSEETGD